MTMLEDADSQREAHSPAGRVTEMDVLLKGVSAEVGIGAETVDPANLHQRTRGLD